MSTTRPTNDNDNRLAEKRRRDRERQASWRARIRAGVERIKLDLRPDDIGALVEHGLLTSQDTDNPERISEAVSKLVCRLRMMY